MILQKITKCDHIRELALMLTPDFHLSLCRLGMRNSLQYIEQV